MTQAQYPLPARVLMVESGSGHGGSGQSMLRLCRCLRAEHAAEAQILPAVLHSSAEFFFKSNGFPCHRIAGRWWLARFLAMRRLVRDLTPDIVHANNTPYEQRHLLMAAFLQGAAISCHIRSSRPLTRWEHWLLTRSAYAFGVSRSALRCLESVTPQTRRLWREIAEAIEPGLSDTPVEGVEVDVIASAASARAEARQELGIAREAIAVLLPATLQPGKGQREALAAAAQLRQSSPPVVWLLAGEEHHQSAGFRRWLEAEIAAAGLADRFRLLGHRDDMPRLLASCDIVALPSLLTEGMPCSILEALAAGRPIAASAVGGIPEIVDSEVGALLPPGDSAALAVAISRLAADPVLRQRCGEAGRRRAIERYDIRRAAARMAKVFQAIARMKRRDARANPY